MKISLYNPLTAARPSDYLFLTESGSGNYKITVSNLSGQLISGNTNADTLDTYHASYFVNTGQTGAFSNADTLDTFHSSYFVNTGQTGSFIGPSQTGQFLTSGGNISVYGTVSVYGNPTTFTTGTDIALGKTATANTANGATYSAAKAVDGDGGTRYMSVGNTAGDYWQVDLGAVYWVNKVRMVKSNGTNPQNYKIRVASDSAFTQNVVDVVTANESALDVTHTFTKVQTQYVRIEVTTNSLMALYTVSVYPDQSLNSATSNFYGPINLAASGGNVSIGQGTATQPLEVFGVISKALDISAHVLWFQVIILGYQLVIS